MVTVIMEIVRHRQILVIFSAKIAQHQQLIVQTVMDKVIYKLEQTVHVPIIAHKIRIKLITVIVLAHVLVWLALVLAGN
jgi:hypothetical protein